VPEAMEILHTILAEMKSALEELDAIMVAEVNQLNRPQINAVALQVLTDGKSKLLATLQHYDEKRLHREEQLGLVAPYHHQVRLFVSWQQVAERVRRAQTLNIEVESRLQNHLQKNQQIQKVVDKVGNHQALYGPAGESRQRPAGRKYDISV
jgi:Flagellar biosynthesis/type III secretory pathway chaperone